MKPVPGIVTQMETPPHIQRRIRYYRRRLHVLGLRLFEPGQYHDTEERRGPAKTAIRRARA